MSSLSVESKSSILTTAPPIPTIRVMVVDDDSDDILLIQEFIKEISPGSRVTCVESGELLIEMLDILVDTELPSLFIFDYNLPDISGFELLRQFKKSSRYQHIPIGIYTSTLYPIHKQECMEAGACIYISKSNTVEGLREDIRQLLSYCL